MRTPGRDTYVLSYDPEKRLKQVKKNGTFTATFGYDGDGHDQRHDRVLRGQLLREDGHYGAQVLLPRREAGSHARERGAVVAAQRLAIFVARLLTDQLGSTAMTLTASAGITGELRYKAYGETRYTYGTTSTKYRFTGQREESTIGLYFYNARWYDAALGRFVQADTVVPQAGDPQALNRYSHVYNNPLHYVDPSGYDPLDAAWEEAFRAAHGRDPTDQDRRGRLFSVVFLGSGPNGSWTDSDWATYAGEESALWAGRSPWPGEIAAGLERFAVHVERLASYYKPNERGQFVAAFAFVWAGVPLEAPIEAELHFATRARANAAWEAYPPLHEGTADWRPELTDPDANPSHHYAAFFHTGYFFGCEIGNAVNWVRDGPLTGPTNSPDLRLGNIAVRQGDMLWRRRFSICAVGDVIRYSLSVKAYRWPANYPY